MFIDLVMLIFYCRHNFRSVAFGSLATAKNHENICNNKYTMIENAKCMKMYVSFPTHSLMISGKENPSSVV